MRHSSLVVIETHPVQYHAPVYRALKATFGIPVTVIYGSDCSVIGYHDREFKSSFAWDIDLLSGYDAMFLSRVLRNGLPSDGRPSVLGMRKALAKANPGAVLIVGYSPRFYQFAFVQAWRSGIPILFRGETTDHARRRSALWQSIRRIGLRVLYKSCAKLLFVGEHSNRHFTRHGVSAEKLVFSPYCVDTKALQIEELDRALLREQMRNNLSIGSHDIVFLFSGKLSKRKGPDLLLSAVKALPIEIRERSVVLFMGSGDMEATLKASAKETPEIKTHFVGFQNQRQLSPYYHSADLLVLPSRHSETWGLVVNEALHHGLPSVVSKAVGCSPDLIDVGVTGEVCETNSTDSLVAALVRALALINRVDIRNRCREKLSAYTVEKAAKGIADAYWAAVGTKTRDLVRCHPLD